MAQLVNTLEYLQSQGIMHRDLKPMNIMLDANYNIKLIDFGDAKNIYEKLEDDDEMEEISSSSSSSASNASSSQSDDEFGLVFEETVKDENGNNKLKKFKNQYANTLRERCDTIVGTANYLSPEVVMQYDKIYKK